MKNNICYLFLEKNRSLDSQSDILEYARRCSDAPKECFVKTASFIYKDNFDFIYVAEAYGFDCRLNDYYVVGVPGGNMTALHLKYYEYVKCNAEVPDRNFLTPEIALKIYEIRKCQRTTRYCIETETIKANLRNQLKGMLSDLIQVKCSPTTFSLLGFTFPLSANTIELLNEHEAFTAAGVQWLSRFDPEGNRERAIFDRLKASVQQDSEVLTSELSSADRENLLTALAEVDSGDLFLQIKDQ